MIDDPLIGRQLANFRIERLIGRGGMALVYYGQDVKLHRPVAIKLIDARYRDNPAYAERFVREAQAVAGWRHEHIIHIYYASDEDGLYYFVMEYIDGADLGKYITHMATRRERIPYKEAIRIGRAMAGALDYAHQRGVVHRDVKPANVLLASDGRIVLSDFGLAMDVQQGSLGEVFGSSLYIAPEQARRSAEAVPQSDQYSLGVILYQMLTGALPFDDPSPASVALQHITRTPPPPRQINPALNVETEEVLLKVLNKAPADRYAKCRDFIGALEQALGLTTGVTKTVPSKTVLLGAGDEQLIGMQLDEYRLEALLGHGGMARVYRARDTQLNRLAAVKVIDTPFRADADYVARFRREAQASAQLDHPNIVRLYRYGEVSDVLYMAMQYIEGRDLETVFEEYAAEDKRFSTDRIKRLMTEICSALDYAHTQGVIHRDVKPSNIIIDPQGRAVLTDFGLALLVEAGTRGEIFGSPFYIAPEQAISSANATMQSDLYSAGVILYELITGRVPFIADNPLDVAMLHMTEPPRPPSELNPQVTPQLEAVILKALEKEPNDRYQTGAELVAALDQALRAVPVAGPLAKGAALAAVPIVPPPSGAYALPPIPAAVSTPVAPPVTPVPAPAPRKSRKPLAVLLVLLLLGLLIGGGALALSGNSPIGGLPVANAPATPTVPIVNDTTATPPTGATPSVGSTSAASAGTTTLTAPVFTSPVTATQAPATITSSAAVTSAQVLTSTSPLDTPTAAPTESPTATATLTLTPTAEAATATPTLASAVVETATAAPTETPVPPTSEPTIAPQAPAGPPYFTYLPIVMYRYRAPRK
jgi:serine/threonine protein kinase